MSGEEQLFNNVTKQDLGSVTFDNNFRARAVGIGSVGFCRNYTGGTGSTRGRTQTQSPEHKPVM